MTSAGSEPVGKPGREKAVRGTAVTLVGQVVGAAIRLANTLALSRLLVPDDFGAMALVNVFAQGLYMFSDLGLGPAIVQQPDGEKPRFLHTAFTLQLVRGAFLVLGTAALAFPVAALYDLPSLRYLVPVSGLVALVEAFTSTKVWTENRHLRLARLTAIDLGSYFVGTAAAIACAYLTRSVIAIPFGGLFGSVVRVTLSHVALPGVGPGLAWDRQARRDLVTFGRWIFLGTALAFVSLQIDRLVLGRLVSPATLGIYSIAVGLASIPRDLLQLLSSRIVFPMFAELLRHGDSAEMREVRRIVVVLLVVPVGILVGASHALVDFLYDDRYRLAGDLMAMLGIGTWLSVVGASYGVVVLASGEPKWMSFGTAAKAAIFASLSMPVLRTHGIVGVALLVGLAEGASALSNLIGARKRSVVTLATDAVATVAMLALAFGFRAFDRWLTPLAGTPLVSLVLGATVAIGVPLLGARRLRLI